LRAVADNRSVSSPGLDRLTDLLHTRGERLTPARTAILGVLEQQAGHLTAEEIVDLVAVAAPDVHRASVHRTLDLFSRLRLVQHLHPSHGPALYHLVDGHGHEHVHAECRSCGRIIDLPDGILDDVAARLLAETGFDLHAGHVTLSGLCRACQPEPSGTGTSVQP
jgi:Fur family ferric uptake transcriptional regulator